MLDFGDSQFLHNPVNYFASCKSNKCCIDINDLRHKQRKLGKNVHLCPFGSVAICIFTAMILDPFCELSIMDKF